MARPKNPLPTYRHNKAAGRGFVVIDGERQYTGKWGTQEANDRHAMLVAGWIARGRTSLPAGRASAAKVEADGTVTNPGTGCSVKVMLAAYWIAATAKYTRHDGTVRDELENIRCALKYLKRVSAPQPAADFTTRHLKVVRREMIRTGLCRNYANRSVSRIVGVFRWAMLEELIPATVHHALSQLPHLSAGEEGVRETSEVQPVPEGSVEAVLNLPPGPVRAMVDLQAITAARPGELRTLRTRDVDRSDPEVWAARLVHHKTAHKGKKRTLFFGPKGAGPTDPLPQARPGRLLLLTGRRGGRAEPAAAGEPKDAHDPVPGPACGAGEAAVGSPNVWTLYNHTAARSSDSGEPM